MITKQQREELLKLHQQEQQSAVARLLARENIVVQRGNFPTAWFDTQSRVLGLPLWESLSRDATDVLVAHEVGHSLFTTTEAIEKWTYTFPDAPHALYNILEDIRIEKKIQREYLGLPRIFGRGYRELWDGGFLGISTEDEANQLGFLDRINIAAKVGNLIDVKFRPEEQDIVSQAFAIETEEDLHRVTRLLINYVESQPKNDGEDPDDEESGEGQPDPSKDGQSSDSADDSSNDDKTDSGQDGQQDQQNNNDDSADDDESAADDQDGGDGNSDDDGDDNQEGPEGENSLDDADTDSDSDSEEEEPPTGGLNSQTQESLDRKLAEDAKEVPHNVLPFAEFSDDQVDSIVTSLEDLISDRDARLRILSLGSDIHRVATDVRIKEIG